MAYLKTSLPENQACLTRIVTRVGQSEGQFGKKFTYKIEWNGTVYDHDATLTEEKKLQAAKEGEAWTVTKKLNSYGSQSLYWDRASGPSAKQVESQPTPVVKQSQETDWDAIADSKIVHAFLVEAYKLGRSVDQAKADAVAFHKVQLEATSRATDNRLAYEKTQPSYIVPKSIIHNPPSPSEADLGELPMREHSMDSDSLPF